MRVAAVVVPSLLLAPVVACSSSEPARSPAPPPVPVSPSAASSLPAPDDPLSPRPAVESPAPPPAALSGCRRLTVQDADLLADEHRLQEVFAVRTSGPACRLQGWPAVELRRGDGSTITVTTRRTGRARPLGLTAQTSLSFVLGTPRTGRCEDVSTLLVRLPGTTGTITVPTTMQVCSAVLEVGPVERRGDVD